MWFWKKINLTSLWSPISGDDLDHKLLEWMEKPVEEDFLGQEAALLAQDTSAFSSGGAVFVAKGGKFVTKGGMFVEALTPAEVLVSSTLREIKGVVKLVKSRMRDLKKEGVRLVVIAVDNWGTMRALKKGTGNRGIMAVAKEIFELCIAHNLVVHPIWQGRDVPLLKLADTMSRIRDLHDPNTSRVVLAGQSDGAAVFWLRVFD